MSRKSFALTPLAAAILLASGGVSAQVDLPPIISNADGQVIDVQAGETINADGVNGVDIVNPNVTLNNDGTILSNQSAVSTSAPGTVIDNIGLIDGDLNGVNFVNGLGAGDLINQDGATIQSDSRAVNIGGEVILDNAGDILGTGDQRNGTVYADSVAQNFEVINDGTIDAGEGNQGAGFSAELSADGNDFIIDNAGTIQGRGQAGAGAATAGDGVRLERSRVGGSLANPSVGVFNGTITNTGTIDSESTQGTTAGIRTVNGVSFQGEIINEAGGTISGDQNGLYFGNATPAGGGVNTGTVENAGTISSDSRALNIDGSGLTINNTETGEIIGTGVQRNGAVYADSTAQDFTLNNDGLIDASEGGAGFSVELSAQGNDFEINNGVTGVILGQGQAPAGSAQAGDGLRFERARVNGALDGSTTGVFTGTVNNDGLIDSASTQGTTAGIRFVNGVSFQGEVNNNEDGIISGAQNGLYFGNATPAGGGENTGIVNNAGTISSDSRALNIDGSGLTINNTGDIIGTGTQRNGTVYADSTAQDFVLNNDGNIDAEEGGAGFSAELSADGNAFEINNGVDGIIQGRGNDAAGLATAGDGIRLERSRVNGSLMNPSTGLFTGTINNDGVIASEGANGTVSGVRVVDNVGFQGEINNNEDGLISGTQNGLYFGNGDHTGDS